MDPILIQRSASAVPTNGARSLEVVAGLTGLWGVRARYDRSFAKYIELDTAYVENSSFGLDLKMLLRTAGIVLQGAGV
ncbi:MAG: sugar transferase [Acidobacteriaceae bacterium]